MARLDEGNLSIPTTASHGRTRRLQARAHQAFRLPLHPRPAGGGPAQQIIAEHQHRHDRQLQKGQDLAMSALSDTGNLDTVTLGLNTAATSTTQVTSTSISSATSISGTLQERQNSPPSSPVTSYAPSDQYPTITLVNNSPVLILPDILTTAAANTTRRKGPSTKTSKKGKPKSTPTTRRRPSPTSLKPTRTPLTRTRPTKTSTPKNTTAPSGIVAPLPVEPPQATRVVHLCIARPPPTGVDAPQPPLTTFTSTVNFPANTMARTAAPSRDSADPPIQSRDTPSIEDNDKAVVLTVTDYNCQITLPLLTRPTLTLSTSASTLSPNNDNTTLPPLGPNVADPTTGSGDDGSGRGTGLAFFATPGGKGTIASITVVSAAWLIFLVIFFMRRRKREDGEHDIAGAAYRDRDSVSSFGDHSDNQAGGTNINPLYSPAFSHNMNPEMAHTGGTGPPGSFFVERRKSQPPSMRGTETPPRGKYTNQLDVVTAARAISPLTMLQVRPHTFTNPPPPVRQHRSNDGSALGEDNSASGSSHGHDPFRDPSSTGHTTTSHDPTVVAAFTDKQERRRSGYTSDTYRKRRSRPLSVRNPDSDETRRQEGVESLQLDRAPRSASSDAIYRVDNAPVPDSTGLEYYLASAAPTPRGNTSIQGISFPTLPPMAPNTLVEDVHSPETPKASQNSAWASWHGSLLLPQQLHAARSPSAYDGMVPESPPGPSKMIPEFETHETYAYPQPRPIVSTASSSTFPRPHMHPLSMQPSQPRDIQPAASAPSSHLSRVLEYGVSTRQHRQSVSSDGASSRSSIWRVWEHNNRSFISTGSPNDVQDVQLGVVLVQLEAVMLPRYQDISLGGKP